MYAILDKVKKRISNQKVNLKKLNRLQQQLRAKTENLKNIAD